MVRFGTEERLQHANRGWAVRRTTEIALTALGIVLLSLRGYGDSPTPTRNATIIAATKEKPVPLASANFEQEWSKLIGAAKQEGTVAIASGGAPSRQYLALISSRENNQRLVPSGSLVPFASLLIHPEVIDKSAWYRGRHWYRDKESKYAFIYHVSKEEQYETWYNTDKIKETEIETIKKQTDFFDPRWKGKIAGQGMGDPSGLRQMIDSYFEPDRGQDWIRNYLLNAGVTFSDDRRILETWLTGGRFPLQAVATGSEDLITLAKKGLPIKQVFFPKQVALIRAGGSGCCISAFANAPHPNAAKLFINWFLSKEGQTLTHTMVPNIDRSSLRNDVPFGEVVPEQRRSPNVEYGFPDADPKFGARQEEAQKWILKIWESRQK